MRVARHDGVSTWQDEGNSATTGTVAAGSVTSNLITSFSPFTLGSTVAVVLPVELLEFEAKPVDNSSVRLTWTTASESNNDRFELERSQDGDHFEFFGSVKGAGNSVSQKSYVYTDLLPFSQTSYYRLKQVDYDGKFIYTPLRPVTLTDVQNIQIYPNPNNGNELFLNVDDLQANEVSIYVTDITGKLVTSELNEKSASGNRMKMVFPQKLASGTYLVNIKTAQKSYSCRLIVN
jgi:Secretion system C-terminal sorting domain